MMAAVPSDLHATIETRLRAVGQRYTPKRRALVDMADPSISAPTRDPAWYT